jgi:2,4-dichlorophenol 6-monooxygenase
LIGDPDLKIELLSANTWTVNNFYATQTSKGRVFCMGDAIHRHPPSNGLGSNTSIQDSFNLAWKLAMVLRGQAGEALLDSYNAERAPVAKQIVTRANQSIGETGPIFDALGMSAGVDPVQMQKNLEARSEGTPAAQAQREAIRKAIAFKKYEFDAHGVEMNQRYRSDAIVTDGQIEPAFELDADLHYQPTTWPGARLPHVWVYARENGAEVSTLDLCGHGKFTVLTGLGGEAWVEAAQAVGAELGIDIVTHVIGPRRPYVDHSGDWARASEITDSGCLLVRPDHHVAWRAETLTADAKADLGRVLRKILAR